jgi:hypothetical protein
MVALTSFLLNVVASLFKSKRRLEAENAALRHQLILLQRKVRVRVPFTNSDRLFFAQLYRGYRDACRFERLGQIQARTSCARSARVSPRACDGFRHRGQCGCWAKPTYAES